MNQEAAILLIKKVPFDLPAKLQNEQKISGESILMHVSPLMQEIE